MSNLMFFFGVSVFFSFQIFLSYCWPGFQVLTERTEVVYNNLKYVKFWVKTGRGNRTTIMSNATIDVYQTIPKTAVIKVVGYEFKSNEYRRSAIDFSKYICDFFNGEYKMLFQKTFEKCGHAISTCPPIVGHYYWYNFVMEAGYIPFKPIGDRWMFEGNLTLNDNLLSRVLWYIKIERNSEFWSQE